MFGRELAFGDCNVRGKLRYLLLGHDFLGLRVRALHVKKMLKDLAEPRTILDAGCGDGSYSFYLARRFPRASIQAVDKSRDLIEACEKIRSRVNMTNLRFIVQDLTRLPNQPSYDLILCIDVLEHVLDDDAALNGLRQALSDRGTLLLHVPQRRQLNRFVVRPLDNGYVHDHVRDEYTEREIEDKIQRSGLYVRRKSYTFGWAGSLARELYYYLQGWGGPWGSLCRFLTFPCLLALGWLDATLPNTVRHQGFLYILSRS